MLCNTKAPGQLQASCAWRKQKLHPPSRLTVQSNVNKPGLCRWAPDSKEATDADEGNIKDSGNDPMTSRRLINQLLQIQSMSSMQSVDISPADDKELSKVVQQTQMHLQQTELPSASSSSAAQQVAPAAADESSSLFDDPAAEDFDPLVLDMLGFTSVAQYLEHKTAATGGEAKVSVAAVSIWALMAAAMVVPLGGASAYSDSLAIFTDGGLEMGNLLFLWVAVLSYYSIKGCVMSLVMSLRAWRLHEQQGERLEELAQTVQAQDQRRAFWKLQEKMQNADERANRTYAEFALASLLLGLVLLMSGGPDHLQLQLETLDQEAYLKLLVVLWLFWETYFATVGSVVKVSNWVSAVLQKWQYKRKWGAKGAGRSRQ